MDLCDICRKEPAKVQITGQGCYCLDCYNKATLKEMGIKDTYDYPRHMSVVEPDGEIYSFNVEHIINGDVVTWEATEVDGNYCFRQYSNIYDNGAEVAQGFFRKIVKGVCTKSLSSEKQWVSNLAHKDGISYSVKDKGVIQIIEDEERDNDLGFVVDGIKFTPEEFGRLFGAYIGWDIHFEMRDGIE